MNTSNRRVLAAGLLVVAVAAVYAARELRHHRRGAAPHPPAAARFWKSRDFHALCAWLAKDYDGYGAWGTAPLEHQEERVAELLAGSAAHEDLVQAREELGDLLLRHGRNDEAIGQFEAALAMLQADGRPLEDVNRLRRWLGVAHLRKGETDHCIAMHNPKSCLFPIAREGIWNDVRSAIAAGEQFTAILESAPDDLAARWLLNLAYMSRGAWPDEVPARWRIGREMIQGSDLIGRFDDVAGGLGVDTNDGAGGAIVDDFDGDGFLDLITSSIFPCEPLHYYHSRGDGTFEEWTERAGLSGQLGGLNCVHADADGDGRLDVLVLRGAWMGPKYGRQPNSLLKNRPDDTFEDVTLAAGLGETAFPTQAAAWADYDRDGDLDLYIGNEIFANELYRNQGDGTFVDVAEGAGVRGTRMYTKGVGWGDYDNDGNPDLYTSNWAQNALFHNLGDGTFVDVAHRLGVDGLESRVQGDEARDDGELQESFATWFWDVDNDGWLDIYVSGYASPLDTIAADYVGAPVPANARRLRIYRNDGHGGFQNVAHQMEVDDVRLPMGANFGDVNNDGWPDVYLGTGRPDYDYLLPNVLYLNQEGRRFADVTTAAGVGHLQKGHGVAFGDLDNDGDQDLFAQMGGFYPADAFRDALFENPGNDNHWVTLVLRGAGANPFAVGARLRVVVRTPAGAREIHAQVGAGGSFGDSSMQQEIGLGDAEAIDRVEVRWPASGELQVFEGVPIDRFVELTEGEPEARPLERERIRLAR